jgi:rare lipoprotein A
MAFGSGRGFRAGVLMVFLCLAVMSLAGCGSKYVPGASAPPATGKKAPAGKGGTYRPYTVMGQTYYPLGSAEGYAETGVASWYGPDFHGKKTANGEWYDMHQMTAAHRILPMHTKVMVRNLDNGRVAEVRINDRGPFVNNRVIDLSYAAASVLGVVGPGTARVHLETIPGERIQYVGPFFVQYGAFVVEANARNLRNKLVARGFPGTRVTRGDLNGTTYWRVQVGAFPSLTNAESVRQRLAKESPDCFVIAD